MMILFRFLAWGSFGLLLAVLGMPFTTWQFWTLLIPVTALVIMEKELTRRIS